MSAPAASQPLHDENPQSDQTQAALVAEHDSALGGDDDDDDLASLGGQSSTASITSTVLNYKYEVRAFVANKRRRPNRTDICCCQNGRRYHAYREGEYVIPNDEREQERLDIHHHIFSLVLGGELYCAPIPEGVSSVLDLGTGTGVWAIDMAETRRAHSHPGIDLSPIQPTWVPPNCRFEVDDFELDWRYTTPFDFIHARNIEGSVKDHRRLFRQAWENLIPGGWLEAADATVGVFCDDETIKRAPNLLQWREHLVEASRIFGKPMGVAQHYKDWLMEAGFVNVKEVIKKVPFSPWPVDPKLKELGSYQQILMLEALDAYSFALFTRVLGWSTPQIQVLLAGVRKELLDRKFHGYSKLYFVYGQKAP
ncbi:uncharacterized protein A1O5_03240 [Cladophialophora psammophila CBS 110553]|uniref:Methyltransferase n=1 Tax=Cladophialophora psammophila CBS 110553 TaxID=1182543 RepID=W9XT68_9EURO|nr:uncharacterized protein A1O5_03240 [Cladophialophora psammophila CBS 110553]EXJ73479.1 hypothetical protein A1O5_03240 [Cladophialophora psammophila CBS 110553]